MRHRTYLIADPHFLHEGVCKFLRDDGSKLRPWDDAATMTKDMAEYWNDTVRAKGDKVYVLGDVAFKPQHLEVLHKLHGDKVLIKGNHDTCELKIYQRYFRDVRACHILDRYLLTHIPIHPMSLARWRGNIHGHLHYRDYDDPRYLCVSVEHTNYRPILWEEVRARFDEKKRTRTVDSTGGTE